MLTHPETNLQKKILRLRGYTSPSKYTSLCQKLAILKIAQFTFYEDFTYTVCTRFHRNLTLNTIKQSTFNYGI